MSYIRPARKDEVIKFLEGFFGDSLAPVVLDALANALIDEWDLVGYFKTAT